jgi:hypothetical protein
MKINSISIVPEDVGCNYRCKYCIAHMTYNVRKDIKKPGICLPKLEKCLKYSKDFGASTAIVTSSGETLFGSWTNIENILWLTKKYFGQIDIHTNAAEILVKPAVGRDFSQMIAPYISNITITVASHIEEENKNIMGQAIDYNRLFELLNNLGIIIRLSCVICKSGVNSYSKMLDYIDHYKKLGISQIVFRELWMPKIDDSNISKWNRENAIDRSEIDSWIKLLVDNSDSKSLCLWGDQPYDYNGVGISSSTSAANNSNESIKSVVYRPDNFLYPDWSTKVKIM